MLQLQIGFPAGRYCAASHSNPREPEWPPHPSRIYSALVAGAYGQTGQLAEPERLALDRLAMAGPPALSFPDADTTPAPDNYVPVNDEKTRLDANKSRGVLSPNRQVRQFPSAYLLGAPEVSLYWDIDLSANELVVLDRMAARMTHVGTSHTLVTARFHQTSSAAVPRWVPDAAGRDYLRVPLQGRLDELDRQQASRADTRQRITLRTRFDFSSGPQHLAQEFRQLAQTLDPTEARNLKLHRARVVHGLFGGPYERQHSYGWDPATLLSHAHQPKAPTHAKPLGQPLLIWLAVESLPLHPVLPVGARRAITTGFVGFSAYAWPQWTEPMNLAEVRLLRQRAVETLDDLPGIDAVWTSGITTVSRFGFFLPATRTPSDRLTTHRFAQVEPPDESST